MTDLNLLQSLVYFFLMPIVSILIFIIFIQVVVSWLMAFGVLNLQNPTFRAIYYGLDRITAPMMEPVRRILPSTGGIDFSPLVVLLGLYWVSGFLLPNLLRALG